MTDETISGHHIFIPATTFDEHVKLLKQLQRQISYLEETTVGERFNWFIKNLNKKATEAVNSLVNVLSNSDKINQYGANYAGSSTKKSRFQLLRYGLIGLMMLVMFGVGVLVERTFNVNDVVEKSQVISHISIPIPR